MCEELKYTHAFLFFDIFGFMLLVFLFVLALNHMLFFLGSFSCVDFWRLVLSDQVSHFHHFSWASSLVLGVLGVLDCIESQTFLFNY
jgi:hypothetical protein